jgi:hypothetical protein
VAQQEDEETRRLLSADWVLPAIPAELVPTPDRMSVQSWFPSATHEIVEFDKTLERANLGKEFANGLRQLQLEWWSATGQLVARATLTARGPTCYPLAYGIGVV